MNTCHATFLEIEGDKLGEEGVKVTWERRLAMVAKGEGEGGDEAFVIAKYNLVPENLLDTVQVGPAVLEKQGYRTRGTSRRSW